MRIKTATSPIFEFPIYTAAPILTGVRDIHPIIIAHFHLSAEMMATFSTLLSSGYTSLAC